MPDERHGNNEPCEQSCEELKSNCESDCCKNLEVKCDCIDRAECVPILTERIFDCVCLESVQFAEGDLDFTIDNWESCMYKDGASICIDKVGLTYDFIGLIDPEITSIRIDGENNFIFQPPIGLGYTGCTDEDSQDPEDGTLYDEYVSILSTPGNCCSKKKVKGVKVRVFGTGLRLFVCNAEITVAGRIGTKPFRGSFKFDGHPGCPFEITSIPGINPLSIYGKVCTPQGNNKTSLHIEFKPCVSIDCVQANERYNEPEDPDEAPTFNASVEGSLLVNTTLTTTLTQKLAVFTSPSGFDCHDGKKMSGCKSECKDKRYREEDEDDEDF